MKENIRSKELELAYDKIMAREDLQLLGPAGAGKSHLLQALRKKLEGRRLILSLGFEGVFEFEEFVFRLREELEKTSQQNQGLAYQMKRLNQEYPLHRIRESADLYAYIESLTGMFFNIGLDLVICLQNPEYSEVPDLSGKVLIDRFQKMARAANLQLLVLSEHAFLAKPKQLILKRVEASQIWDDPNPEREAVVSYGKGNIGFVKSVEDNISQNGHFNPEIFFKSHNVQFRMLRNRFTNLQWRLLRALAATDAVEQPHAFDFLVRHKLGAASSVERALQNLLDSNYISRSEEGYQLTDLMLHRWIQYVYFQKSL